MTRIGALLAAIVASTCLPGTASDRGFADELSERWVAAYNSGDIETLGAIYASDARLHNGHCPVVVGRTEIERYWDTDMGEHPPQTRLTVLDSLMVDDIAYVSGSYEVESTGPEGRTHPPVVGAYSQIWRREQGGWTVHRESWTNLSCVELKLRRDPDAANTQTAGPHTAI